MKALSIEFIFANMLSIKLVLFVTLYSVSTVVSRRVVSTYGEPSMSSQEDTVSASEIHKVLNDQDERKRLSLSVDQVNSGRPDVVPSCLYEGHIYDPVAKKCSEPKTRAHCGNNMIFLPVPNTTDLGSCACANLGCWGRPHVLLGDDQCYGIGTLGPCDDEETLVPVDKFHAECGSDACLHTLPKNAINFSKESKQQPDEYTVFNFTYDGKCYTTESEAFCTRGQVVRFVVPYKIPVCVSENETRCWYFTERTFQLYTLIACGPGTVANPDRGICQPEQDFDFE